MGVATNDPGRVNDALQPRTAQCFDLVANALQYRLGRRDLAAAPLGLQLASNEIDRIETELRPKLYREGVWYMDYKRLRIAAITS